MTENECECKNAGFSPCPHEQLRSDKDKCPWMDAVAPVEDPSNSIDRKTSLIMFGIVGYALRSLQNQLKRH